MTRRTVSRRLLAAGAGAFALAVAAEAVLRLLPGALPAPVRRLAAADPRAYSVAHPYIGILNRTGPDTDPHGFRTEWPWPPPGAILTLGDSVTLAAGVAREAGWPALVGRAFPGRGVVNLAVGATGPQQYLRVLETFGLDAGPALVLVGFHAGNDFWDAAVFDAWLAAGAGAHYLAWRDLGRPRRTALSLDTGPRASVRTALWKGDLLVRSTALGRVVRNAWQRPGSGSPPASRVFEGSDGARLELSPDALAARTRHAGAGSEIFARVLETLTALDARARGAGARTLVLFLPSKEEVYLPLLGDAVPDLAGPLRLALREAGIDSLDLLDAFREAAAEGDVLFQPGEGPLPDARGHALIAARVVAHLRARAADYGL